jgi:hypothetical protein
MSDLFIPESTEWFIGELVEEFQAADEPENLVHINTILIQVFFKVMFRKVHDATK